MPDAVTDPKAKIDSWRLRLLPPPWWFAAREFCSIWTESLSRRLGSVERSWTKWANLRGLDPAYVLSLIHGRRAIESVAEFRPDLDPAEELKLVEDIELADGEGITVLPGVKELIAALPKDRWTVVTSATERLARMRLAGAGFVVPERLVTADTVNEGKPNPAPYLAGAERLGFAPE